MLTIKTTGIEDYLDPQGGQAWVQAIIIGGHGVGKTPYAANWPKPIFAMCEHGTMSIARNRVPYGEIHNDRDMDAFLQEIRKDCVIQDLSKRKYLTVVIDTIDSYQKRLMQQRVVDQHLDRFTGWDNWDWLDAQLVKVLSALSQLPVHLVVNVHYKDQVVGEGDDKSIIKELRLKGDQKTSIFQEFDLIGFMETYYATEGGQRVRKRHIRWWPIPGYEMVRDRSNTLPEFTPVDFRTEDFQIIFDHLVAGVDTLEESHVVTELQVEGEDGAEAVPTPDEGAGPVADPKLPPARKAAAEKVPTIKECLDRVGDDPERAQQMLAWEQGRENSRPTLIRDLQKIIDAAQPQPEPTPEPTPEAEPVPAAESEPEAPSEPEPEPQPDPEPEPQVEEEPPVVKPAVQNGVGTAEEPVEIPEAIVNDLDAPKYSVLKHVHSETGKCLLNRVGPKCGETPATPVTEEPVAEAAPAAPAAPAQPAAAPASPGQTICGDQPASFAGKYDPKPGCGNPLTADSKAPLAVVKYKTYLCSDCFAAAA